MKYNKTEIMRNAWTICRSANCTMSEALRRSWAAAKAPKFSVKFWFLSKEFSANERIAISGVAPSVARETEKAVFLRWNTSYGVITRWVPKSCLESADLSAENTAEKCAARLEAIKARQASYDALIADCRAHGIPARKGWSVSIMKQKLAEVAA